MVKVKKIEQKNKNLFISLSSSVSLIFHSLWDHCKRSPAPHGVQGGAKQSQGIALSSHNIGTPRNDNFFLLQRTFLKSYMNHLRLSNRLSSSNFLKSLIHDLNGTVNLTLLNS